MSVRNPLAPILRPASGLLRQILIGRVPKLFDAPFYLARHPGVARSGLDPFLHYVWFGARRGDDPNADFDGAYYRRQSGSTRRDPLRHYIEVGAREGLDPSPSFSTSLYLARYPDVASAGINPLLHYRTDGRAEGREAIPSAIEPDRLRALDGVPAEHQRHYPDAPKGRFSLSLIRSVPTEGGASFAPRFCLHLALDGIAFEAVLASFATFETGPQDTIALHVDAARGLSPPTATLLIAFERCFVRRSADGREIRLAYAEARLWDLRAKRPGVAAVFPAGAFAARHLAPGEAEP